MMDPDPDPLFQGLSDDDIAKMRDNMHRAGLPHWRWQNARALLANALLGRARSFLLMPFWRGLSVSFPLQLILKRVVSPRLASYADHIIVSTLAVGVMSDRRTRTYALYTPYQWWCRYVAPGKARFAILWYWVFGIVPHLAGTLLWRRLHLQLSKGRSGFWGLSLVFAEELVAVMAASFVVPVLQSMVAQVAGPKLRGASASQDGDKPRDKSNVIDWYQNYVRRVHHQDALRYGQEAPNDRRQKFVYLPLKSGQIRLLRLKYGKKPSDLELDVDIVDLQSAPGFIAISYVWGDPARSHGLVVNGKWLPTTQSTFEILHEQAAWWNDDPYSYIWMDFVCINQDDTAERAQQVKLMKEIYSHASEVIAYLKPDDPDQADVAVSFFNSLLSDVEARKRGRYGVIGIGNENALYNMVSSPIMGALSAITGMPPSPGWEALSKLLGHKLWTRVWILQELIVASGTGLRVFYGEHELSWPKLGIFARLDPDQFQFVNTDYATFVSGEDMEISRHRIQRTFGYKAKYMNGDANGALELPELLTACRSMAATDPRDRIFALQGILPESFTIPQELLPNYDTTTKADLYYNVAKFCVESMDPEFVLGMAGTGYTRPDEYERWPSWVPDWTTQYPVPLPYMRDRPREASERSLKNMEATVQGASLRVRGLLIDKVHSTLAIESLFDQPTMATAEHRMLSYLRAVKRMLDWLDERSEDYPTGGPAIDALGNTLIAGQSDVSQGFRLLYGNWMEIRPFLTDLKSDVSFGVFMSTLRLLNGPGKGNRQLAEFTRLTDVCDLRGLAVTEKGYFALVPRYTEVGDDVYMTEASESTLVLRSRGLGVDGMQEFEFVGDCFMYGRPEAEHRTSPIRFL